MLFETVLRAFRNVHLQGVLIGKRVGRYLNGACEAKEICHFFQKKIVDNFGSFEKRTTFALAIGKMMNGCRNNAEIAQLVEHNLAKVRVASSSLVFRSFQIKKSRKHCSVLAGFFCCMEVVVTVSVMRIRASFRRSCWPASRYSSEWSCCFCWRGRLSVSVACPIRTAGP